MQTTKDIIPKIFKNLLQPQAQPQSTDSESQSTITTTVTTPTITLLCPACGKTRPFQPPPTNHQHHHLTRGTYTKECTDCQSARRQRHFDKICPPLYRQSDPAKLPASQLKQALQWKYGPMGLLLLGDTGTGKTRVAWTLIHRLLVSDPKELPSFSWFDGIAFGHAVSKHYRDESAEDWLHNLASKSLLFFDDLGKLKLTERAETELFGLIERRCASQLPIIATTNDTGDSLAARMTDNRGPALIRRLREFCQIIQFGEHCER